MGQDDIERAMKVAKKAESIAQAQLRKFRAASSWFSGSREVDPEQVFYDVMETECMLLYAVLQVLSGGVLGKSST